MFFDDIMFMVLLYGCKLVFYSQFVVLKVQ